MPSPNILFLLSDQHNPLVAGFAGDPWVRTPNLDRLAGQGVSLSQCYCAAPLCVPSRMALMSGRLPDATGVFTNDQGLHSDTPTMAHGLAIAGYETVLCGRMHFVGPDQRHGYLRRLMGDCTTPYLGMSNDNFGTVWAGTTGQNRKVIEKSGPGNSAVLEFDRAVTTAALGYLAGARSDRPWFLTVGWYGPHCTYCCPRKLFDYYMERLPLPSVPEDFAETCHPAVRQWMQRRDLLKVDPQAVRRARAAYYGMVEIMDQHLGRILGALDQAGLASNTLICYASDHGDCIGHNGLWWKSNLYEGSVRVPCVFAQPGVICTGRSIDTPTSLLDLAPTFLRVAGSEPLPRADGVDLNAALADPAGADAGRAVLSMHVERRGAASAMIRRGRWKLVAHDEYAQPQLFNLERDPAEQHDLGADPHHADIRAELSRRLHERWNPARAKEAALNALADAVVVERWDRIAGHEDRGDFWCCPPEANRAD